MTTRDVNDNAVGWWGSSFWGCTLENLLGHWAGESCDIIYLQLHQIGLSEDYRLLPTLEIFVQSPYLSAVSPR